MSTPEPSSLPVQTGTAIPVANLSTTKSRRVLACVLCQQRKVKCDRIFPCANCVRIKAQCIPSAKLGSRQRRPRFPERVLLDRLGRYESLLRENNIEFEPLHKDSSNIENKSSKLYGGSGYGSQDDEQSGAVADLDRSSPHSTTSKPETAHKTKSFWHAMNLKSEDSEYDSSDYSVDGLHDAGFKKAWRQTSKSNDHLFFGSRNTSVDISTLHPDPSQIFRLWQIYLDNVNQLLRVTHTPTLQARIVEAASDVSNVKPTLAALMFSIYCMSFVSLVDDECREIFGSSREDLLAKYRFGCQQALLNCEVLRTGDRDCLTALLLYLISIRPDTDPHSLSSMLSIAIRIAQRLGYHIESCNSKRSAFDAEMGRRLWWSLILFDTRICELADYKAAMLVPTWDCKIPLNVNDFDLQPDMKHPPAVQGNSTEALFAVMRSEMGDFVRHSAFHLDFINPGLKVLAKEVQRGVVDESELVSLKSMIEERYIKFCNPENPLHFMTIWTSRGQLARNGLIETYSRIPGSSKQHTAAQRRDSISCALAMLDCDTQLMTSPLTKGYFWFIQYHFPLPAYIRLVQDLKQYPIGDHADQMWEAMSDNYEVRATSLVPHDSPFLRIFAKIILQGWEAREALFDESDEPLVTPRIVSVLQQKLAQQTQDSQNVNLQQAPSDIFGMNTDDLSMDFDGSNMLYGVGEQAYKLSAADHGQTNLDIDFKSFNWNAMDWNSMYGRGWW